LSQARSDAHKGPRPRQQSVVVAVLPRIYEVKGVDVVGPCPVNYRVLSVRGRRQDERKRAGWCQRPDPVSNITDPVLRTKRIEPG
jgi:hypothetical protein